MRDKSHLSGPIRMSHSPSSSRHRRVAMTNMHRVWDLMPFSTCSNCTMANRSQIIEQAEPLKNRKLRQRPVFELGHQLSSAWALHLAGVNPFCGITIYLQHTNTPRTWLQSEAYHQLFPYGTWILLVAFCACVFSCGSVHRHQPGFNILNSLGWGNHDGHVVRPISKKHNSNRGLLGEVLGFVKLGMPRS